MQRIGEKETSHLQSWLTTYVPPPQVSRVPRPPSPVLGVAEEGTGRSGALRGGAGQGTADLRSKKGVEAKTDEDKETFVHCVCQGGDK